MKSNRSAGSCRSLLVIVLSVGGAMACESTITGNEGNLRFTYEADDDILDFNKAIAVGASLDYEVTDLNRGAVTLTDVRSSDPALRVTGFSGDTFTLESVSDGNGLIEVEANTFDGSVSDSINVTSRPAEVLRLAHTCSVSPTASYLTDQRIVVAFELERANGRPVIGYGYYPVTFEPSTALTLSRSEKAQQFMQLDTGSTPTQVRIDSTIDTTSLNLRLIRQSEVDGAELIFDNIQQTDVGDTDSFFVLPRANGQRVCQADLRRSVRTDTPEICTVSARLPPNGNREKGWIQVRGEAAGTCLFTVSYLDGGGGTGADIQLQLPIVP